jgi:IMP dehydrogenase
MYLDESVNSLCFDDVLLVPSDNSEVSTRKSVDISMTIGNPKNKSGWLTLSLPVILAPMEAISSTEMIRLLINNGGLGFVQRHQADRKSRISQLNSLNGEAGFAVNLFEAEDKDFVKEILHTGTRVILIDTAWAHTEISIESVKKLRAIVPDNVHIMTGNVSSYNAYQALMDAGADSVRVGIGGGAACVTRQVTGFGVPVLSSVMDVYNQVKNDPVNGIISDGGIKYNGDIVKAFAGGASGVMIGSMFAGHNECYGVNFRGLASRSINEVYGHEDPHVEGVSGTVPKRGSFQKTLNLLRNNISSGCSYGGVSDLSSLAEKTKFIKVSQASLLESGHRLENPNF